MQDLSLGDNLEIVSGISRVGVDAKETVLVASDRDLGDPPLPSVLGGLGMAVAVGVASLLSFKVLQRVVK